VRDVSCRRDWCHGNSSVIGHVVRLDLEAADRHLSFRALTQAHGVHWQACRTRLDGSAMPGQNGSAHLPGTYVPLPCARSPRLSLDAGIIRPPPPEAPGAVRERTDEFLDLGEALPYVAIRAISGTVVTQRFVFPSAALPSHTRRRPHPTRVAHDHEGGPGDEAERVRMAEADLCVTGRDLEVLEQCRDNAGGSRLLSARAWCRESRRTWPSRR
jgi:hypothetical protein